MTTTAATPQVTWTVKTVAVETPQAGQPFIEVVCDLACDGTTETDFPVIIPPEAVGDRMAFYGTATSAEAFEAILREQGCRISTDVTLPAATPSTQASLGGTNAAVAIVYTGDGQSQRDSALAACTDAIDATRLALWDDPRYLAARGAT